MPNIKISMITVSLNSEKTIEQTIKSVLEQDYANLEYIIIDGGSTDRTLEIVNQYKSKIDVIVSEKDNGISDAFNKGIRRATGDVIGIINSDDTLLHDALQAVADNYDDETDVYRGNIIFYNPQTGFTCREIPSMKFPKLPFFIHVAHQGTFVAKKAYDKYGVYDEKIKYSMDLDFLMRVYLAKGKMKKIDFDMATFRQGNTTADALKKKKQEFFYFLEKNGCNKLQSHFYYAYLVCMDWAKKILNLFGNDFKQKLRYRN